MLTRATRLVSLPMLAFLLAIPASARALMTDVDDASSHCGTREIADSSGRPEIPRFQASAPDTDSSSHFGATRPISAATGAASPAAAHLALCRASLSLTPSPDGAAHLTISLSKPLPAGQLVSSLVRRFLVNGSRVELEIDAPEGAAPRVELALPLGTRTEVALVRGNLDIDRLLGDSQIAIVKGNATLHLADADFSSLECATIMGGIRDRRPGGATHGHVLSTWTSRGSGTAKIEFSAVSGDLILLPHTT